MEGCLICGKVVEYEKNQDGEYCPECGWGGSIGVSAANPTCSHIRNHAHRMKR